VPKLIEGGIDAVLLSLPQTDPALVTAPIFSEPFLLACPEGHPATRKGGPTWDGLDVDERLLLEEGHCLREQALAACAATGRSNRLVLLRHKRRRFVCLVGRMQQGQRERFRTMATISLRRIVAIEFGM
jgi:DNA-binding transcriptional LysR family regulator